MLASIRSLTQGGCDDRNYHITPRLSESPNTQTDHAREALTTVQYSQTLHTYIYISKRPLEQVLEVSP